MNRLATETSPYLLQHKNNPVDWYPWGPEALERARTEGKADLSLHRLFGLPLVSRDGARELRESSRSPIMLNEHFVSIKVDREERPDLDQIYMNAVQMMTGRGGWPMSVFLTPDLKPFFGGTYWPPRQSRMGMPGFDQILTAVDDAWQNRREAAEQQAEQLTQALASRGAVRGDDSVSVERMDC